MDITKMSLMELKALAFDLVRERDTLNKNIEIVINRINEMESKNGNLDPKE